MIDILTILGLIGLLAYREWQYQKSLKMILVAKLSQDVNEFNKAVEKEKPAEKKTKEEEEIPLEDMPAEKMLRVLNKK